MTRQSKVITEATRVDEVLERGVEKVIVRDHLRSRMLSGDRLRIKFGIDPTAPHLHLGHTVPLHKLRQFQDLGHQAVLIIGDGTAMIGDPSGRNEARKKLSRKEIDENKKTYIDQASKILDMSVLEVRHNGEWFDKMTALEFLELTSLVTVQQLMQREDFRKRVDDPENALSALEMAYPVMQGYDSVMVKADVEIGGADQELNILMGRRLQRRFNMPEQDVLTVPLLIGTDGERKMSKSYDNAISLEAQPEDMFAKLMSVPDSLIIKYFTLLTRVGRHEIGLIDDSLSNGINPRDVKARMASEITASFYGVEAAEQAAIRFDRIHREHAAPEEMPEIKIPSRGLSLVEALVLSGLVPSKTEARRQIEQGGVKVNDETVKDPKASVSAGSVIQKGKRHFVKLA